MERKTLIPRSILEIEGKVAYGEGFQSWNLIRLKKEFIEEFPQLKEKRSSFSYKMVFCREYKQILKTLKNLSAEGEQMPVLMFLYREKEID